MSQKDVVIELLAVASLIIVLIILHGSAAPSKIRNTKKLNRLKKIPDKEAEKEQEEYQRHIEDVRPDLMNKIKQYAFIQPLLSDAKDALEWKRAVIEPYEGWSFIGSYMQPDESYVYGYTLHQYKVQKYLDRKLQPDNTYALVSKKRTYHQGVAIVAAKRRTSGDIKLYIAEYDSASDGVNAEGKLRWCRLLEANGNSIAALEEAILKALKDYVKQNRSKEI